MPGKPRKPIPGFLNLRELEKEGAKRGRPVSAFATRRQIQLGKLKPDTWEDRAYMPSPLFSRGKLEYWLSRLPTKKQPVPETMTTTQKLLQQSRQINSKIFLPHIQQFLVREFEEASKTRDFSLLEGSYGESHGKQRRLFFPKKLGEKFLGMVRENRLEGLFEGYSAKNPPLLRKKEFLLIKKGRRELRFSDLGSKYKTVIAYARVTHLLFHTFADQPLAEVAKALGVPEKIVYRLAEIGKLEQKNEKISRQSLGEFLKWLKQGKK
ncbi:MAG: hypothetical protein V1777_02175 [Candidatus Micrarchaeota archaeon]